MRVKECRFYPDRYILVAQIFFIIINQILHGYFPISMIPKLICSYSLRSILQESRNSNSELIYRIKSYQNAKTKTSAGRQRFLYMTLFNALLRSYLSASLYQHPTNRVFLLAEYKLPAVFTSALAVERLHAFVNK